MPKLKKGTTLVKGKIDVEIQARRKMQAIRKAFEDIAIGGKLKLLLKAEDKRTECENNTVICGIVGEKYKHNIVIYSNDRKYAVTFSDLMCNYVKIIPQISTLEGQISSKSVG